MGRGGFSLPDQKGATEVAPTPSISFRAPPAVGEISEHFHPSGMLRRGMGSQYQIAIGNKEVES
jgi:hypothetical protein